MVWRLRPLFGMPKHHTRKFAAKIPRSSKRRAGRTAVAKTPLKIRVSGVDVPPEFHDHTRALLGRRLARFGAHIERVHVRLINTNGPRGGVDTLCRIKLTISGRPSVFIEEHALDAKQAFARAAASVARALARSVERVGLRTPTIVRSLPPEPSPPPPKQEAPAPVAAKGRPRRRGMVYAQEESAARPSRKSTRKSLNRTKGGNKLSRRQQRRKHTPKARASRAQQQRRRSRVTIGRR